MIAIDVIKQSLQNNSNKNINLDLLRKLALMKIKTRLSDDAVNMGSLNYQISRILSSKISEEKKKELLKFLCSESEKTLGKTDKELDEIFGFKKEVSASVEADKEKKEDDCDDDDKEERKVVHHIHKTEDDNTPAEFVSKNNENSGIVFKN